MEPLSGLDATFLYAETPTTPMNVIATVVIEGRVTREVHALMGPETLGSLAELLPPSLAGAAFDLYGRWQLAGMHRPVVDAVISNVPGPPVPLRFCGRPVSALRPHGPLMEGVGLNITVMSYAGGVDVGVLADAERVPEAHRVADRVAAGIEELAKLAEAQLPELVPIHRAQRVA